MYKSVVTVYDGEKLVGDVEVCFESELMNENPKLKEKIRVSYYSTPSERCSPLAVLYTITSSRVCLKMESNKVNANSQLSILHSTCLGENKTAVVSLDGGDELHLVALRSRRNNLFPCFWGFSVAPGLYESCLVMLNLRCLGIVFDLDETLIVANTLRSFEDRIEALQRRLSCEVDPQRIAGMLSEIKRYQDDRNILKQYAESDQVVENGKLIKAEYEVVPAISDNHQTLVRPLIRLQEKNIVLTRINPQIRDTSVLVRLRPAWEDLRSYLIARGRKRFEVYVCTMAERDYALEMWRLLDPDSNLISMKELSNRIVCVKSGLKKSLFDVFQDGNCHPKMTLVIDDRLKVWDERDQPRVHVVPAFAPYYAPQAEANSAVPILCVARNVACNVRGGFFKDFDDSLLQRINQVTYEDEIYDILPPDVSNYMVSEDDASALNGSKEPRGFDGMADVEVERRLKEAIASSTIAPVTPKLDTVLKTDFQYKSAPASMPILLQGPIVQCPNKQLLSEPLTQVTHHETSLHSSPAREEGEVPDNELDPDTRRRLLILQHGMDMRQKSTSEPPQFPVRPPPMQVSAPVVEPHGGWFPLGEDMGRRQFNRIAPSPKEPMHIDEKHTFHATSFVPKEVLQRDDRLRSSHSPPVRPLFPGEEGSLRQLSSSIGDMNKEIGGNDTFADSPAERLHYIAFKCGTKVEFRPFLVPGIKLQFSFEVWFAGEKIGDGTGITRREALHHAAVSSLMNLADKYSSCQNSGDEGRFITERRALMREECIAFPTASVPGKLSPKKSSVDALNEQAAETAFQNLKAKIDQYPQKRQLSSRSFQGMPPTKRFRQEDPRVMQRMASARYPKNASLDP